jgi:hypothetical protein
MGAAENIAKALANMGSDVYPPRYLVFPFHPRNNQPDFGFSVRPPSRDSQKQYWSLFFSAPTPTVFGRVKINIWKKMLKTCQLKALLGHAPLDI